MGATKSKKKNKNAFKKVYPYVRRRPVYTYELDKEVIIETASLYFDATSEATHTFTEAFSAVPVVTATAKIEDLNAFVVSVTTTSVTINVSESFTGYVDLHAIYVAE
jgi:hypothetical protein